MTNPFATFRKNQKAWMAALVMVALFAFVIAPLFAYFRDGASRRGGSEVAVKWDGGRMTVADIQRSAEQNRSLRRFLGEVARRVIENGGEPNVPFLIATLCLATFAATGSSFHRTYQVLSVLDSWLPTVIRSALLLTTLLSTSS